MSKDKLIKEFQKYNSDLEKHLPGMNLDFIDDIKNFDSDNDNNDMLALLINTVNDMKIEVALTRKNMADNIEGMVMRVLNNEHNVLVRHVNDLNSKMVANVRDSFGFYVTQLNTELSSIRRELNKVTIATDNMSNIFKSVNSELSDMNMTVEDFKNIRKEVDFGIQKVNDRLDSITDNVQALKTEIPKFDIEKELSTIKLNTFNNNKELNSIKLNTSNNSKELSIIKLNTSNNNKELNSIKLSESNNHKELNIIKTKLANEKKKLDSINSHIIETRRNPVKIEHKNDLNQIKSSVIDDNTLNESNHNTLNESNDNTLDESEFNVVDMNTNNNDVQKILSIDERLRKLDALK